jgi:hypothetical protein
MRLLESKRWSELTRGQQAGVVVLGIVQVGLLGAALRDLYKRPAREVRGPKSAWTAASFLNFIGPISYFVFGRK